MRRQADRRLKLLGSSTRPGADAHERLLHRMPTPIEPMLTKPADSTVAWTVDASHRSDFQCHDGLGFEERLQSQQPKLSTGTRLLIAAERRKRIVLHPVDSHASCLEPTCHCLCSR